MNFATSSTEDTLEKDYLIDLLLLQFNPTGKVADNHIELSRISILEQIELYEGYETYEVYEFLKN